MRFLRRQNKTHGDPPPPLPPSPRRTTKEDDRRRRREQHYLQELELTKTTTNSLREMWTALISSSQREVKDLQRQVEARRLERDEARRNLLKEINERDYLAAELESAKSQLLDLERQVDKLRLLSR